MVWDSNIYYVRIMNDMEKNKAENGDVTLAVMIFRCPSEPSWRRWHLNKDMKEIVGLPGENHSSRGRARSK